MVDKSKIKHYIIVEEAERCCDMEFDFEDKKLQELYEEEKGAKKFPSKVVDNFFRRIATIKAAKDVQDLRALKGARFEKLKGQKNRYSMRLNKKWRLILRLERNKGGGIVVILEISDHYDD